MRAERREEHPGYAALWTRELLNALDPRPGERVLDPSRGTGVDVAPLERGFIALPFASGLFDVVICHCCLPYVPDRTGALAEMRRLLVDGGRIGVSAFGPIERNLPFAALAGSLERHAGVAASAAARWQHAMPEVEDLRAHLACAGFRRVRVRTIRKTVTIPSVAVFVRTAMAAWPTGLVTRGLTDAETMQLEAKLVVDVESLLARWVGTDGLSAEMEGNVAVGLR